MIGGENSRKPVFGFRLLEEKKFCKGLCLCFFLVKFICDEGVFAVLGHGFGLGMFECADTAFLIGAYPSSQVGSGNAVVVCGTLLAAYMQVVEYGLVFEV